MTTTADPRPRPKRRGRGYDKRETLAAFGFLSPWLFGFLALTAGPMVISLFLSFTDYDGLRETGNVGWRNYEQVLTDPKLQTALTNTLIYAVLSVPATMIVSLWLAMMLSKVGRRSAGIFRTLYYLPEVTPKVAIGVLFLMLFNGQVGLVNSALGLVGIDGPQWSTDGPWVKPGLALMHLWSVGGTVIIYLAALNNVPQELYEAADIDGASPWQRFRNVTLPMISGALFFTLIVQTIDAFQSFDEAYTAFYGSAASASYSSDAALFYVVYLFQQAFQFLHMGYASAMAWLLFLVIMVVTLVQVRLSRRFVYYEGGER